LTSGNVTALGGCAEYVRKFVVKADHLDDLVRLGTVTREAAKFLEACVVAGLYILVAGGTQPVSKPYVAEPLRCGRP